MVVRVSSAEELRVLTRYQLAKYTKLIADLGI